MTRMYVSQVYEKNSLILLPGATKKFYDKTAIFNKLMALKI